jgi:hypothetical protein
LQTFKKSSGNYHFRIVYVDEDNDQSKVTLRKIRVRSELEKGQKYYSVESNPKRFSDIPSLVAHYREE